MTEIWRKELRDRNIKVDEVIWRKAKTRALENNVLLMEWVSHAIEIALDFDTYAKEYCRGLGWKE